MKQFYPNLESLRGIAALMVALGHCLIVFPIDGQGRIWDLGLTDSSSLEQLIVRVLLVPCNGALGVLIFFVLSGYVLALSFQRYDWNFFSIIKFYFRRIMRIYPIHIAWLLFIITVLSVVGTILPGKQEGWGGWSAMFNAWPSRLSLEQIVKNILLIDTNLNALTWTLRIEVMMSIVLPAIYFLNFKTNTLMKSVMLLGLFLFSANSVEQGDLFGTYLVAFNFGVLGASVLHRRDSPVTDGIADLLVFSGTLLLLISSLDVWKLRFLTNMFIQCLSIIMIIFGLTNTGRKSLIGPIIDLRVFRFIGAISYSFYLQHLFVLYISASILVKLFGVRVIEDNSIVFLGVTATISILFTCALASWSYYYIERKAVNIGSVLLGSLVHLRMKRMKRSNT